MEMAKVKIFRSVAGYIICETKTNEIKEERNIYNLNGILVDYIFK